jgi:hypothetical protein
MRAGMFALMTPVMTSTLGGRNEHQVGEFVNDDDDVGKFFGNDNVFVARHDDLLVHFDGKTVRARLDFFLFRHERQFRFGQWREFVLRAFVEGLDVADVDARENLVALFHFIHDPAQGEENFFRVGDDRHDQVRQRIVLLQLDDLRVNHHEPELVGRKAVEQ